MDNKDVNKNSKQPLRTMNIFNRFHHINSQRSLRIHTTLTALLLAAALTVLNTHNLPAQEWQFVTGAYWGSVFGDDGVILTVGESGIILRSGDGGQNWEMPQSTTYQTLRDVAFLGNQRYMAVGGAGTIIYSEDNGQSWSKLQPVVESRLNQIAYTGGNRVFVLGEDGTVLRSDDRAQSWEQVGALPENVGGFAFLDGSVGVTVSASGRVYRTEDGGESWEGGLSGLDGIALRCGLC